MFLAALQSPTQHGHMAERGRALCVDVDGGVEGRGPGRVANTATIKQGIVEGEGEGKEGVCVQGQR